MESNIFTAQQFCGDIHSWRGALGGIFFLREDVEKSSFSKMESGKAFFYFFRRFGFPIFGSDDYKDLCVYYLTTPREDTLLYVKFAAFDVYFGYLLRDDAHQKCEIEDYNDRQSGNGLDHYKTAENSLRYKCWSALLSAMEDLKRPTYVRDGYFNVLGEMKEELEGFPNVPYSSMAGNGIGVELAQKFINN